MIKSTVAIAQLPATDLAQAGAVLDAAFGRTGMTTALRLPFALQPESWRCVRREGEIIAVVGAYNYGPAASIGMMAVHPSAQRLGVGERLLAELIGYLEGRGCPLLFLDASAAGQHLYPKFGFVAEGETLRMLRVEPLRRSMEASLPGLCRSEDARSHDPSVVSPMKDGDLEEVVAFDAPLFGANRAAVIAALRSQDPDRAFVARDASGHIAGFLIAAGNHIGPWAAISPREAASLLSVALALPFDSPPFTTCPASNTAAVSLLRGGGFEVTERLLHMRRGGASDPRQTDYLYAQASLTLG